MQEAKKKLIEKIVTYIINHGISNCQIYTWVKDESIHGRVVDISRCEEYGIAEKFTDK